MATMKKCFPPAPETRRGYRCHVHANDKFKDDRYTYTNGSCVFVRSFNDPDYVNVFWDHRCNVLCSQFAPNGQWIASGDSKGRVFVWALGSHVIKVEVEINQSVCDVAWSHDGERVVAVGDGNETFGRAFLWNSGTTLGDVANHKRALLSADFKPSRPFRIASGGEDNLVNFFSGPPFKFTSVYEGHQRMVNCVRFSPSGEFFITVGADKVINIFDAKSGDHLRSFSDDDGHKASIVSFVWSGDSKEILTASLDKTAKLWNVESGSCIATFHDVGASVDYQQVSTVWLKNNMISLNLRGDMKFLNRDSPDTPTKVISGHQGNLSTLCSTGGVIYSADVDGRVFMWTADASYGTEFTGKRHENSIQDMAVNCTGTAIATVSLDNSVMISSTASMELSGNLLDVGGVPAAVRCGRQDADLTIVATKSKELLVIRNGAIASRTALPVKPVDVAVSPADDCIVVAGDKKVVFLKLEGNNATVTGTVEKSTDEIVSIDYAPNGQYVAYADRGRYIYVIRTSDLEIVNSGWKYHSAMPVSVRFSPDSTTLVSAGLDSEIFIWKDLNEFSTAKETISDTHFGGCKHACFVDNKTVASCGTDRCIKLWALE